MEVGEGLMDAMVTTMIAMHDLQKTDGLRNSVTGSVYVVKPKMHGPAEVAFADEIFSRVEKSAWACRPTQSSWASWTKNAAPVRTSGECIRAAKSRVAFINTGFLDRTGDEIHTSMEAGPMVPQGRDEGCCVDCRL